MGNDDVKIPCRITREVVASIDELAGKAFELKKSGVISGNMAGVITQYFFTMGLLGLPIMGFPKEKRNKNVVVWAERRKRRKIVRQLQGEGYVPILCDDPLDYFRREAREAYPSFAVIDMEVRHPDLGRVYNCVKNLNPSLSAVIIAGKSRRLFNEAFEFVDDPHDQFVSSQVVRGGGLPDFLKISESWSLAYRDKLIGLAGFLYSAMVELTELMGKREANQETAGFFADLSKFWCGKMPKGFETGKEYMGDCCAQGAYSLYLNPDWDYSLKLPPGLIEASIASYRRKKELAMIEKTKNL